MGSLPHRGFGKAFTEPFVDVFVGRKIGRVTIIQYDILFHIGLNREFDGEHILTNFYAKMQ
jgi:hypothetical protein